MTWRVALLSLVACGGFTINVDGATDESLAYEALVFEGQCPDVDQLGERSVVRRVDLPSGASDDGLDVGKLDQITHAIAVVGRDGMCRARAFGCTEFEPGPGDRATVAVTSIATGPACPTREVCVSQVCRSSESDAGVNDADTDADADVPLDASPDARPRVPCELESSAATCLADRDCAAPFLTCDGVCVPSASLACETVPVAVPRSEIVDVAIAQYLVIDQMAEIEVWAVSSGELFAGRLTTEVIDGTLTLREFALASGGGIARALSWADRHLVLTDTETAGVFDYNPTPYGEPDIPTLAWAGQLPYCGSENSGVPDAVLFGTRDPIMGPNTAFVADAFFWDGSSPDETCRGDFDLAQVVTAVQGSFAAFADTSGAIPDERIAEIVPTTSSILALYQRDRGVLVWDAQPAMVAPVTAPVDLGALQSDAAPGWSAQSSLHRLVTSDAGQLELRTVRACNETSCDVSEPVVIADGLAPSRLMLVELAGDGRVLLVVRDGALDAMFLSDGDDDPGALLATVRLSGEERIADIDAFFDRDADTFAVVGLDEDGAPHVYRLSVP